MVRSVAIGIDLAWAPKNPTGLAVATITPDDVRVLTTTTAKTNAEILDFIRPHLSDALTIAIDAPTIVPNETGMRPVERGLLRDKTLLKAHATAYPANRTRLGEYNGGIPRGEELIRLLRESFQVLEVGLPPARHDGLYAMEVFPLAAMVRLFSLTEPLPYKAKKGRSPELCRAGLSSVIERLQALTSPALTIPDNLCVNGQVGSKLKGIEDRVDAVVCAYLAALASLGQAECLGDTRTGYIVMPKSKEEALVKSELAPLLGSRFSDALVFAADIHRQQLRKGTQIPYISHVIGVASIALEHGADEDEAIAALLHDAIEDAPDGLGPDKAHVVRAWIEFKFDRRVLEIVEGCTDTDKKPKPPWKVRKEGIRQPNRRKTGLRSACLTCGQAPQCPRRQDRLSSCGRSSLESF